MREEEEKEEEKKWTKGSPLSAVSQRDRERERGTPAASKSRYLRPLSVTAVKRASRHSI